MNRLLLLFLFCLPTINYAQINSDPEIPILLDLSRAEARQKWWSALSGEWQIFYNLMVLENSEETFPSDAQLQKLLALKSLDLSNGDDCGTGPYYSPDLNDLSGLSQLVNLESLYSNYMPPFKNLKQLRHLSKLCTLSITDSVYDNWDGIEYLTKLSHFSAGRGDQEAMQKINLLTNLKSLRLEYTENFEAKWLTNLKQLESLSVWMDLRGASWDGLEQLEALKQLDWECYDCEVDFSFLEKLKKLKRLECTVGEFKNEETLASLPKLGYLNISINEDHIFDDSFDLRVVQNLSALWVLELRGVEALNSQALKKMKNLSHLELCNSHSFDFRFLKKHNKLSSLDITSPMLKGWSAFSRLSKLNHLSISNDEFTSFSGFPHIREIEFLTIRSASLLNLKGIEKFSTLENLNLEYCPNIENYGAVKEAARLIKIVVPEDIKGKNLEFLKTLKLKIEIPEYGVGGC